MRIIYETDDKLYRIVEHPDQHADMGDLKGDCYNPKANPDIDPEKLREEEKQFKELVEHEGVFGYVLEHWDPTPGAGYMHVDSCWGFVGQYSPGDRSGRFDHYIVNELRDQIPKGDAK